MKKNQLKYMVKLPTVSRVVEIFHYERHNFNLVDESNVIRLTRLEELIADDYQVQYGTDDYTTIEETCFKAYQKLIKTGDFNE